MWIIAGFAFLYWLAGFPLLFDRLVCPFQVAQGEAANVEFGRILARGENLYFDPAHGPFLYPAYPPLFPLLLCFLSKLLSAPFFPGRLLALSGYLACGGLLLAWGWRRWDKAWCAALLFLFWVSPTGRVWGTMGRMDTLLLAVEFGAFLLLYGDDEKKGRRLPLAAALSALALLLKQSALILLMAYSVSAIRKGDYRVLARFLAFSLVPVAAAYLLLQWSSGGWFFFWNFRALPLTFHWSGFFYYLRAAVVPEEGWLFLAVGLTLILRDLRPLLKWQLFFSFLLLLALGREGAAENYLLEPWLYGIFALGEGWGRVVGKSKAPSWAGWTVACLLLVGLLLFLVRPLPRLPSREEMAMKSSALSIYRQPGEHLALDADLPLMAGKKVWIMPMEYTAMVESGKLDMGPFLKAIRERKFATIELYDLDRQYLLPAKAVEAVEASYQVAFKGFGRRWYVPRVR
ncbi:MAG TPA: hypothetical protein VHE12_10015 [bacterium]|nr:hypothetical protein [bacterium]